MKIGICGGSNVDVALDTSIAYIGVDRGIETLLQQNIIPIIGVGDFDSMEHLELLENIEVEQLSMRKDVTDTHHAIDYAIEQGYTSIDVYGVTGGRLDHFMAVLCLLQKYREITITIIDNQNRICLLKPGSHTIYQDEYTYFSLFALVDSYITITSCQYPLERYYLTKQDPLCVSNQVIGAYATITTTKDILLIKSKN